MIRSILEISEEKLNCFEGVTNLGACDQNILKDMLKILKSLEVLTVLSGKALASQA